MTNIFIIAAKEILDAARNRWFLYISVIFAGLSLAFSLLGLSGLGNLGISGFGRTTASLLNLVLLIVPLMGLLLGAISLAGEKEQGTLRTLLAQPVTPAEIFIGKYAGTAAALTLTLCFGFGLSGMVIGIYGGWNHLGDYAGMTAYTVLLGMIYLGIGFLISIFSLRTAAAVGVALFAWFLFLFFSDLGLMGTAVILKLAPRDLLWLVLSNPTQSFKAAVIGLLHGDLDILGATGRYAVDILGSRFLIILSAILGAWIVVPSGAALWFFQRKAGE